MIGLRSFDRWRGLFSSWIGRKRGFTLVEVLIALAIFTIVMGLVLVSVTGLFRSLRQGQTVLNTVQRQRFCLSRLSKEISSVVPFFAGAGSTFKGQEKELFFIFAQEESLVESIYIYNAQDRALERYCQEPTDYDWVTRGDKEVCIQAVSDCKFSYSDGESWQNNWDEEKLSPPRMVKINFKLEGDEQGREFLAYIPVTP